MMIRVLHVVGSMNRGGIETFLMNIYRNIDRGKVQFDFAVHTQEECAYDNEIKEMGGRIFYITPRAKNIFKHYKDWHSIFQNYPEIQIIHQHVTSLTYINPLKVAKRHNVKHRIIHSHSVKAEGKLHYLMHLFNSILIDKYANIYFSCSNLSTKWLFGKSNVKLNEVEIINNAIDVNKFRYDVKKRDEIRRQLSINGDFVIGHVGRFSEPKNHKFLIDIFGEVSKNVTNSKLLLIGHGHLEREIRLYVKKNNLDDKVIFLGSRSDVSNLMQAMDVFLFPSLYEGLGIVLIEAQVSGLKCFVSKDVVPPDVKLTNELEFISLLEDKKFWGRKLIDYYDIQTRIDRSSVIKKAGFNISDVALNLQEKYINCVNSMV